MLAGRRTVLPPAPPVVRYVRYACSTHLDGGKVLKLDEGELPRHLLRVEAERVGARLERALASSRAKSPVLLSFR